MKSLSLACVFSVAVLLDACGSEPESTRAIATTRPNIVAQTHLPPSWAQIIPGTKAYTRATIREVDDNFVSVCPTKTDFSEMMSSGNNKCVSEPPGVRVVISKTRQDPGVFGGDAIYVIAKRWSGLIADADIVPIVPKGTLLHCDEDDSGWYLYVGGYSNDNAVDIGRSAFKAVVRHSLEPNETLGPAVHILSGGGRGKDGSLLFESIRYHCKIEGTSFIPDFDVHDYENHDPADGTADGTERDSRRNV